MKTYVRFYSYLEHNCILINYSPKHLEQNFKSNTNFSTRLTVLGIIIQRDAMRTSEVVYLTMNNCLAKIAEISYSR
jgi:hypothetical protein